MTALSTTAFCADDELGYVRSKTPFASDVGLTLDESYRLAHLPLVAPRHPRVIAHRDGAFYEMGRHATVFSLVLPIPNALLQGSDAYRDMERELRASPLAAKIAWDIVAQRQDRLHATVCGSLAIGDEAPAIDEETRRRLAEIGPIDIELRGLFSGNVNVGRLYLRAYPERRDGENMLRRIQRLMNRRETDLYVVGLYNLINDLDASEAAILAAFIERWWDRAILRMRIDELHLMGARDDLVLDAEIVDSVSLTAAT